MIKKKKLLISVLFQKIKIKVIAILKIILKIILIKIII
jgi:hypothetical protein